MASELECPSCGQAARLVELTAEDVQRIHPPSISMVCEECREKYRSAARLETTYKTRIALRDLALMTIVAASALIALSDAVSTFRTSIPFSSSQVIFFATAVTSLTGLKMAYSAVGTRYGFTHDLAWSLHSRYAMLSIALVLSGILIALSSFV